jgi:hypothetical protein
MYFIKDEVFNYSSFEEPPVYPEPVQRIMDDIWKGVRMRFERKQKEKELQEFLAREEELRIERKIKRLEGEVRRLRRELAAKEKEMEGISE